MVDRHATSLKEALIATLAPAMAVEALARCIGLIPQMNFASLADRTKDELKLLDADVVENAVRALEDVDVHLENARSHATQWDGWVTKLLTAATDAKKCAKDFLKTSEDLRKQISAVKDGGTAEQQKAVLQSARSNLKEMRVVATKPLGRAKDLADGVADLAADTKSDSADFAKDRDTVKAAITAKGAVIDKINEAVAALNDQLAQDGASIARGKIDLVPGIGMTAIGAIFAISGQVKTGVSLVSSGISSLLQPGKTVSDVNLDQEQTDLAKLQADLSLLQAAIGCFRTSEATVAAFAKNLAASAAGAADLSQIWQGYDKSLENIVKTIDDAVGGQAQGYRDALKKVDQFLSVTADSWTAAQSTANQVETGLSGIQTNVDSSRFVN